MGCGIHTQTMRRSLVRIALSTLCSIAFVGCGAESIHASKLEERIESTLRDAAEGYEASCPEDVPWEPPGETFSCQLVDKDGNKRLVGVRVFGEGSRELRGEPGVVVDFHGVPQATKDGSSIGNALYKKTDLE